MGRRKKWKMSTQGNAPDRKRKPRESYQDIVKENALFESYYKAQKIISDEEWTDFMKSMRTGLPSTFRITGIRGHAQELMKYLKKYYLDPLSDIKLDEGEEMDCFGKPLIWYPNELAWQINLTRRFIRRSKEVSSFHKFLVNESEMGNLSRQEAVSMIPPLLIDVEPHHKILDLCAAPGSKTAQLIEMLNEKESTTLPEGFVIANDIDPKRCYMLVHQSRRIHSPCCLITNHDASAFPDINIKQADSDISERMLFDRILCDVPCSGDGTLRKNQQIWKKWNPEIGVNLHKTQLRILVRAVEMLAIGGRAVYSTCSLNPVENEAVVSELLMRSKGSVELVDVSDKLPLLKRSPGLEHWQVHRKDGVHLPTFSGCSNSDRTHGFLDSMWPPTAEDVQSFNLNRCWRLYPHHQDTGGFFIAVLQKKSELPWEPGCRRYKLLPWELTKKEKMANKMELRQREGNDIQSSSSFKPEQGKGETEESADKSDITDQETANTEPKTVDNGSSSTTQLNTENNGNKSSVKEPPKKKRKVDQLLRENIFTFVGNTDPHWTAIREFFGISKDFPEDNLLVRSADGTGKKRVIYFVSTGISVLLRNVDQREFRVVNAGLRMFTRGENSDKPWAFRINGESLDTALPFLSKKRVINVPQQDLVKILIDVSPKVSEMTTETKSALGSIGPGCIIFSYDPANREESDTLQVNIGVCGWRSNTVILRTLIAHGDRMHYLRIAGFAPDSKELQRPAKTSGNDFVTAPGPSEEPLKNDDLTKELGFGIDDGPDGAVIITDLGHVPVPSPPPGITDVGYV